jgi:hypothetical protein
MLIACTLTNYRPKSDKSFSITFNTLELTKEQKQELDDLFQTHGILYFKGQDKINKDELIELDKIDLDLYDSKKTQSQRLRAVWFLNWQKDNKGFTEFKDYYAHTSNTVIEHFKQKLND